MTNDNALKDSLYLHPNENPATTLVYLALDAATYHSWSHSMLTTLNAKNKIDFFVKNNLQPKPDDASFFAWYHYNTMVASWIVDFVSPSIRQSIIWMDNSYDIWTDLKHCYSQGDLPRISEFQMDVPSLCQDDLIVSEYFTKLKVIWDELSNFILEPLCSCEPKCACNVSTILAR